MPTVLQISCFRRPFFLHLKLYSKVSNSNLLDLLNSMPKEPKHISEAQKQRKKIKEKLSRYVPGRVTLQLLGTGAKGAPRSLYLFSDQSRYLFNCGEGTQRLAHEHKMKLSKLEHIFITQPVWKNIGGLPGTALTIQDVGVPEITLHGPPGLDEIFVATKRFVIIRDLKIHMAECGPENVFQDNVMAVRYVPLSRNTTTPEICNSSDERSDDESCEKFRDSVVEAVVEQLDATTSTRSEKKRSRSRSRSNHNSEEIVVDDTDYYAHERKKRCNRRRSRTQSRSLSSESGHRIDPNITSTNSQQVMRDIKENGISMIYVCRLHRRPGALNLDRCVKMGVPAGPLLGRLKAGENVILPNGKSVSSKDVCEPDDPGPLFIVVDCPNEDYLESLVSSGTLKKHQRFAECDEDVACLVVHFSPKEIISHPRYMQWMDDFPPSTEHLMVNEMNSCMGSQAVHRIQYKLNLLSEDLFPLLGDKGTEVSNEPTGHVHKRQKCDTTENEIDSPTKCNMYNSLNLQDLSVQSRPTSPEMLQIFPNTFCSYCLRPRKGLDRTTELRLNPNQYISETMALENFADTLQQLKNNMAAKMRTTLKEEYPKILFLGTGSCIPNKTRNTSGIMLQMSDSQNIILDCGEGTYGQIVRFFGEEKADRELADVSAVYISHLHADHHIGLVGLLQGRRRALDRLKLDRGKIYLFAPKQILAWLSFYDRWFENISDEFVLLPNRDFLYDNDCELDLKKKDIFDKLEMEEIKTCLVRHCPNAFGLALTNKKGLKITYSGDTMPSDNLVELGRNSDILIHEATMEDELAQEAVIKMHSTTSQAIEVGRKMNAKNILLTHFSQRYAKLPRFNDNFADNVGIAFDNMLIRIDQLSLLPTLHPALKIMFAEHYEELEHKAVKRQMKLERERSASREGNFKQNIVGALTT